eukprot:TRINITY_DN37522_c0_g1_i3.p1 TRINITY_DN37522_c0_g1~~TRINITY_DN37522_c0_g1_i3.p1  ORF type:complete len:108 (-),score=5.69 TRINITY_DN37522_c0_g1_i3:8-331(-)
MRMAGSQSSALHSQVVRPEAGWQHLCSNPAGAPFPYHISVCWEDKLDWAAWQRLVAEWSGRFHRFKVYWVNPDTYTITLHYDDAPCANKDFQWLHKQGGHYNYSISA